MISLITVILISHSATAQITENRGARIPAPSAGQSINQGASQGKSSQMLGQALNAAAGAAYIGACFSCSPTPCYWYCAMGLSAFAQAGNMGSAAGKSGAVFDASLNDLGLTPTDYGTNGSGTDQNNWMNNLTPDQKAAFQQATEAGYKFDKYGNVTTPDGKSLKSSDFKNAESMAAAGIPSSEIGGILSTMDKINKELSAQAGDLESSASVVAMGVDGGGGGGSRGLASVDGEDAGGTDFDAYLNKLRNPFGLSANKKKEMVAGKTVRNGEDVIGVKVDDIFQMVHRRYQEKRASDEFIEPAKVATSGQAVPARSPAATRPRGR